MFLEIEPPISFSVPLTITLSVSLIEIQENSANDANKNLKIKTTLTSSIVSRYTLIITQMKKQLKILYANTYHSSIITDAYNLLSTAKKFKISKYDPQHGGTPKSFPYVKIILSMNSHTLWKISSPTLIISIKILYRKQMHLTHLQTNQCRNSV